MDILPSPLTLKYILIPFLSFMFGVEKESPKTQDLRTSQGHLVMVFRSPDTQEETLDKCREVISKRLERYGVKGHSLAIAPEKGELVLKVNPGSAREAILTLCTEMGHLRMEPLHSESECERFNIVFRENYPKLMAGLNLLVQYPIRLRLEDHFSLVTIQQYVDSLKDQSLLPTKTSLRPRLFDNESFKKRDVQEYYWLKGEPFSLGDSLQYMEWKVDETGTHEIELEILDEKDSVIAAFTQKHLDAYVALLLDEHVWITPKVLNVIEDGRLTINYLDDLNFKGLLLLQAMLEGGTLPYRLEFTEEYIEYP